MNVSLFFICGLHTCGKTTILKKLEDDGEIVFRGSEIGKDLYYQRKFSTETAGEDIELEVAELELKRDEEIASLAGIAGIETWHPGNMAYAAVRNPGILPVLRKKALASRLIERAFGVWIEIDTGEIRRRTQTFHGDEEWVCEFYSKINAQLEGCFKMLGLWDRVTVVDGNQPVEAVIQDVRRILRGRSIF